MIILLKSSYEIYLKSHLHFGIYVQQLHLLIKIPVAYVSECFSLSRLKSSTG